MQTPTTVPLFASPPSNFRFIPRNPSRLCTRNILITPLACVAFASDEPSTLSCGFAASLPELRSSFLPIFELVASNDMDDETLLEHDYYGSTCPNAGQIIRDTMSQLIKDDTRVAPQLLRLFFHDCFIEGCHASILLDVNNGNPNNTEKNARPNETLKGFDKIDAIKKALEAECPGIVSCSDILAVATRDGIIMVGGPYYPVLTGRKDSLHSYLEEAIHQIPRPDANISDILDLFGERNFTLTETVSLLGAHNIGKIDCQFLQARLYNFQNTSLPDPSIPLDFHVEMQSKCPQNISNKMVSGTSFDSHYYERLTRGCGFLFADQQLMAQPRTAELV